MIGNFFKGILSRDPHRNQILIVCERCGHEQYESKIVVSTHCKNCRHHIKISGGKTVKSRSKREIATFSPASSLPTSSAPETTQEEAGVVPELAEPPATSLPDGTGEDVPSGVTPSPEVPLEPERAPPPFPRLSRRDIGQKKSPQPEDFPRQQTGMAALNYFREVVCFYCNHVHKANRKARATICPNCEREIILADVAIHDRQTKPVMTRGNLIIHKTGFLKSEDNKCCDFRLFGGFEGSIECNDFFVSTAGSILGNIHCKRLIVERKCEVNFPNPIFAERVEILGKVTGDIHCHGNVKIGARGCVEGSVSAYSVSIEDGGELAGNMNIMKKPGNAPLPSPLPPVAVSPADS